MISIISGSEAAKWDNIVKGFERYDVMYLNGYSRAFQAHGGGEPLLFFYEDSEIKAINVVMKRDIAKDPKFGGKLAPATFFDLSTPYGYGGFWVEGKDYAKLGIEFESYCRDNGFISEFVRFHLFSNYPQFFNGLVESHSNNIVRSLELDLDSMMMDFEHKVRKNLATATRAGLEIEIDQSGERLEEFLDVYYGTMDRNQAKPNFFFSKQFFDTLHQMRGHYAYFYVVYESQVISTELVLFGKENCYSFLGGTRSDYYHLRPNDYLKFEIIKWAKGKGLKRFVLGGGYGEDDGIFRYKKSFSPTGIHKFCVGKRIFDRDKYEALVQIRGEVPLFDMNTKFFPKYRG